MTICEASPLLLPGADATLRRHLLRYDQTYDQSFWEVHVRLNSHGAATKADLSALIFWKHIQNARWMVRLLTTPDTEVRAATANAFLPDLSDAQRLDALSGLPGFRSRMAMSTVILAAFDPTRFGVYDKLAHSVWSDVASSECSCTFEQMPEYFEHLRMASQELSEGGEVWTPRMVDMALFKLGGG